MGVQGQVYIGALAATYVALSPVGADLARHPARHAARWPAGAFYGFLPGIAKAKLGANEIVSSLMLNYIAIELVNYLVRTDLPPRQRRADHRRLPADRGVPGAGSQHAHRPRADLRDRRGARRLVRALPHELGPEAQAGRPQCALRRICRHQGDLHHGLGDDGLGRARRAARRDVRRRARRSASCRCCSRATSPSRASSSPSSRAAGRWPCRSWRWSTATCGRARS